MAERWREWVYAIFSLLWTVVALLVATDGRAEASSPLSAANTLLFGPGLHKDTATLPLNYFFIQGRDSAGTK